MDWLHRIVDFVQMLLQKVQITEFQLPSHPNRYSYSKIFIDVNLILKDFRSLDAVFSKC